MFIYPIFLSRTLTAHFAFKQISLCLVASTIVVATTTTAHFCSPLPPPLLSFAATVTIDLSTLISFLFLNNLILILVYYLVYKLKFLFM